MFLPSRPYPIYWRLVKVSAVQSGWTRNGHKMASCQSVSTPRPSNFLARSLQTGWIVSGPCFCWKQSGRIFPIDCLLRRANSEQRAFDDSVFGCVGVYLCLIITEVCSSVPVLTENWGLRTEEPSGGTAELIPSHFICIWSRICNLFGFWSHLCL